MTDPSPASILVLADSADRFFGAPDPLAPERLRTIGGGGSIALGDRFLSVLYTPGHASHHVAFVDSATGAVFAGEAVGSHLPWVDVYRPALPPPEADVEAALASIELIASRATMLLTSHYGPIADASDGCARAAEKIREWADAVEQALRTGPDDIDRITGLLRNLAARDYLARSGEPIDLGRYDALGSLRMNAAGLTRYWKKRWEREAGGDQPS